MQNSRGKLIVVSGPSGAGKSTVIGKVMEHRSDVRFSVSATTRAPRPGEVNGSDYQFVQRDEFIGMIEKDELLEYAEYVGNMYGTPADPVKKALDEGLNIILDIEVQGALQVKAHMPEAIMVFLIPPNFFQLEERLRCRNKDSEEKILGRLEAARREYSKAAAYEYIVVNGDADIAAKELNSIIVAESCRREDRLKHLITDTE